ncbi:MAG: ABC transporter ATP-binding protein [Methylococcales bacterium]
MLSNSENESDPDPFNTEIGEVAIQVENLCKVFDGVRAVDRLSFMVPAGTLCALLGANGAGKTTTLAMLLGLLIPSSGVIRILGIDMVKDRYRALPRMNFTSPYVDLPHRLSVFQNLEIYARLYGIRQPKRRILKLADELTLGPLLKRPYGSLSAGQRTRVSLAKSLLNEPEVLLMDEPTASLDPASAQMIRGYLREYQQKSRATVLLASHNMQEVERLCENILIMKKGRVMDRGTPEDLLRKYGRDTLEQVFIEISHDENSAF